MTFRERSAVSGPIGSGWMLLFWLAFAACATTPPREPNTATQLNLIATDGVNPNVAGVPSPVVLILYELAKPEAFEGASFNQLFYGDGQALGDEALARQEFRLKPGEIIRTYRILDSDAKHLGFVAGYRQIDQKRWRLMAGVGPQTVQEHVVVIGPQGLSFPKREHPAPRPKPVAGPTNVSQH